MIVYIGADYHVYDLHGLRLCEMSHVYSVSDLLGKKKKNNAVFKPNKSMPVVFLFSPLAVINPLKVSGWLHISSYIYNI